MLRFLHGVAYCSCDMAKIAIEMSLVTTVMLKKKMRYTSSEYGNGKTYLEPILDNTAFPD